MREALDYWRKQAGDRAMPRRADFNPFKIPKVLPYLRMLEILGPRQYRFRLVGSSAQPPNVDLKSGDNHIPDYFPDNVRNYILDVYDEVMREKRPLYYETTFNLEMPDHYPTLSLILALPFSEDGTTPNLFMTIHFVATPEIEDIPPAGAYYKERLRVLL